MPGEIKKSVLLPSQRKDIFDVLKSNRLDPSQFAWEERTLDRVPMGASKGIVSALVHRGSDFYFLFDMRTIDLFFVDFSPSSDGPHGYASAKTFGEIVQFVRTWCGLLRREMDTPDVWADIAQVTSFGPNVAKSTNDAFTTSERQLIAARLDRIEQYASTSLKIQGEQSQFVHQQFEYLKESSERLGKKDWLNTFAGVILSIAISTALPADQARGFFQLAIQEVSQVVTGLIHGMQSYLN